MENLVDLSLIVVSHAVEVHVSSVISKHVWDFLLIMEDGSLKIFWPSFLNFAYFIESVEAVLFIFELNFTVALII